MSLTEKQKAFVRQFPIDLCQTKAAIRAGYSAKTARSAGLHLMRTPEVRDAVRKELDRRCLKFKAEADKVIQDLADIAHIDKTQAVRVVDGVVYVTDTDLLPERIRRCISKVAQTQHGVRIEFDDRTKALELLGRHLALFKDCLNLSGNIKTNVIDDMSEEEIDAELARLAREKAAVGEKASTGEEQPS